LVYAFEYRKAQYLFCLGVYGINPSVVAIVLEVGHDIVTHLAGLGGCPNHSHPSGVEKGFEQG
jgi:hypothetical protein